MIRQSCYELFKWNSPYKVAGDETHFTITCKDERNGCMDVHRLEPGCVIGFEHIANNTWETWHIDPSKLCGSPLIIKICMKGRCDFTLIDRSFITISEHRMVFTNLMIASSYNYPMGYYDGIQLFIEPKTLRKTFQGFSEMADLDIPKFIERYLTNQAVYFQYTTPELETILRQLWALRKNDDIGKLRLLAALLLRELMGLPTNGARMSLLSKTQLTIVDACRSILCEDLSKRITLKQLANRFQLNENSLKSYFRQAYGQSLTEFMTDRRVEHAQQLLTETSLRIADIGIRIGYENPSKFSAAFRKATGLTPSEYRKAHGPIAIEASVDELMARQDAEA